MKKILILNGPNLNLLGRRENSIYGNETLDEINATLVKEAQGLRLAVEFFQSNCEGALIDKIHEVMDGYDGCVINAGAYTHYSYAISDAITAVRKPFIEVHISNIHNREEFRRVSVLAPVCVGQISGMGKESYVLGLRELAKKV